MWYMLVYWQCIAHMAQWITRRTSNPNIAGSNPAVGIVCIVCIVCSVFYVL